VKTQSIEDPREAIVALQKPLLKSLKSALPYLRGQRLRKEIMALMVEIAGRLKEVEYSKHRRKLNDHDET